MVRRQVEPGHDGIGHPVARCSVFKHRCRGAPRDSPRRAGRFKSDLDKDKTLAKPEKDAAKKDVEALVKQADTVKSRINDGKPATGEVRQLVEQTAKLQAFVDAHPNPAAVTNWQAVQASLGKLQQAFGLVK